MRLTRLLASVSKLPKCYSNFPESYIKRTKAQVEWRTPKGPQYRKAVIEKPEDQFIYTLNRPWTEEFQQDNDPKKKQRPPLVEPIDWIIFRGDRVQILVGKDTGKQGIVNYIVKERNWVIVEGLNAYRKTMRTPAGSQLVLTEAPLLVTTQVALVDPTDEKPTKVEWRYREDGEKVRVSVRSGRIIPIPLTAEETVDFKTRGTYVEKAKDTNADQLAKITFVPKLTTFEMDIMEEMGIKDDRVPQRTFWY